MKIGLCKFTCPQKKSFTVKVGTVPIYLSRKLSTVRLKESFVLFGIKAPTNFGLWWPI